MPPDPLIRRVRAILGQGLGGLVPVAPTSPAGKFLDAGGGWSVPAGGGGGGASTHSSLAGLRWVGSGHTDAAYSIPWFAASGAAATLGVGSVGQFLGSAGLTPSWATPSHPSISSLGWSVSGHTGTPSRLASFDGSGNPTDTTLAAAMEALSSTQGAVLYRNASAWVALAAGTAGQRLRTGGSGANPAWADLLGFYGDGSDGSLNFDGAATVLGMAPSGGVYTFTREVFATDVTVGSGVRLALESYGLYVNGTLSGADATSFVSANGLPASGVTAGGQQTAAAPFHFVSTGGGTGRQTTSGAGGNGGTVNPSPCGAGGNGGAAGANAGGNGGSVIAPVASRGGSQSLDWVFRKCRYLDSASFVGAHAGSGGGGGGLTTGGGSGGGGGGGGGARAAVVFARLVAGTGYIEANGGVGGNSTAAGGHTGGGGGGGGGGAAILVTSSPTPSWTVRANGGTAGSGAGGGSAGSAGAAGLTLTFIL
jgi:hypothetical protein